MRSAGTIGHLRGLCRRFARDRDGVSALEFALILPFMVTAYLGSVELGNGLAVQYRVTLAARSVADLASQYIAIDNSAMSNILGAAAVIMTPYSSANMTVTVSEVSTDANGKATVTWSDALNGSPRTVGSTVTLPKALQSPNISLIWGEVTYPYNPQYGYVLTGTIYMYQNFFFYPRQTNSVTRNNS